MIVFVDTNILIDFVCSREPFADAARKFFARGYIGDYDLCTSALSFVNAMYIGHKYNHDEVKSSLMKLSEFVKVLDLQSTTVVEMLSSSWKDYEDATQNQTAILANADCIVTRNKKDFLESSLSVYTISELFEVLN